MICLLLMQSTPACAGIFDFLEKIFISDSVEEEKAPDTSIEKEVKDFSKERPKVIISQRDWETNRKLPPKFLGYSSDGYKLFQVGPGYSLISNYQYPNEEIALDSIDQDGNRTFKVYYKIIPQRTVCCYSPDGSTNNIYPLDCCY